MLKWSEIQVLVRVLGEKTAFLYLWAGHAIYIAIALLSSFHWTFTNGITEFLVNQVELPLFFILGFIHALSYFIGRHLYFSGAPECIAKERPNGDINREMEKNREALWEELQHSVEILTKSGKLQTERVLGIQEEDVPDGKYDSVLDTIAEEVLNAPERARLYDNFRNQLQVSNIAGLDVSRPWVRGLCMGFLSLSLFAWAAHVLKLLLWSISSIDLK
ncbi:hypothetical protein QMT40_002110 [Parvibaculaceae bacterium PLY_AMNH_Bact1]|nr:hypothetical protein QMT40_002110 [Parvibaculaceae bacterium PLY_AMNH_Bact1]